MFRALIADDHPLFRSALRQVIEGLFSYGAAGFIPKSFCNDQIRDGMHRVISGEVFLRCDPLDRAAVTGSAPKLTDRVAALTQGELHVFELLAKGKSNKIIAYELGIKESTVKAHISSSSLQLDNQRVS